MIILTNDLQVSTDNVYKTKLQEESIPFYLFSIEENGNIEEKKTKLKNQLERFMGVSKK